MYVFYMNKYVYKTKNKLFTLLKKINFDNQYIIMTIILIILFYLLYTINKIITIDVYKEINYKDKFIFFGQTCDLENNQVSIDYSLGFQLAFYHINEKGVLDGYKLKIILLNDQYETNLAIINAKLLVDYYHVLALFGSFGTPTTVGIFNNVIKDRPIPLIAPFSAGNSYRKIFNKYRIYMNTDFYVEFDLLLESLLKNNYKNISILYQNDIYGSYFYNAFVDYTLKKNIKINIISSGHYERNSDDLDNSFKSIFNISNPYNYKEYTKNKIESIEAIILFAAEKEISSYLGVLKKIKPSIAIYYNFFTGNQKSNLEYLKYLNKDNIYQSLLSKNINNFPKLNNVFKTEIKKYNKINKSIIKETSSSMMQGFYTGLMIGNVLNNFKTIKEVNRETFIDMFYKMKYINVYDFTIGPFIMNKSSEGIKYGELNKLMPNLEFKTISSINLIK
jgi:hypothetical protein